MKKLIRWVIGNCQSVRAIECLHRSVQFVRGRHPDADLFICYNNLTPELLDRLPSVDRMDQQAYSGSLELAPPKVSDACGPAWKLYPPRLDIDAYEVILDNDILFYEDIFESFFGGGRFLVAEAARRSYDPDIEKRIRPDFNMNCGIYGMPPGYDLGRDIKRLIAETGIYWDRNYFLDQSLLACLFQEHPYYMVPLEMVSIVFPGSPFIVGTHGVHFAGLNKGKDEHWKRYWLSHMS